LLNWEIYIGLSFSQGTFPSKFKHASVTPPLKNPGLDPTVSANFRPISNLNKISKILERLFLTRLQPYIASSPSFIHQSAYHKNITLLKSFSFTSLILSTMQLIIGSPLFSRLELRRLRADLLICYTRLHHSVDLNQEHFLTMISIIKTRGNSYKLSVPNSRINARVNYFFC